MAASFHMRDAPAAPVPRCCPDATDPQGAEMVLAGGIYVCAWCERSVTPEEARQAWIARLVPPSAPAVAMRPRSAVVAAKSRPWPEPPDPSGMPTHPSPTSVPSAGRRVSG